MLKDWLYHAFRFFSHSGMCWTTHVSGIENGCHAGDIYHDGAHVAQLKLSIPGRHNLFNATMAVAACAAGGFLPAAGVAHRVVGSAVVAAARSRHLSPFRKPGLA